MVGLLGAVLAGAGKIAAPAAETKFDGVLIDKLCSYKAETRIVPGPRLEGGIVEAYTETRECALKPECQKSGYGVFTYDNQFVPFDAEGNRKALALLKETKQEDNLIVEVTGKLQDGMIKVDTIVLK